MQKSVDIQSKFDKLDVEGYPDTGSGIKRGGDYRWLREKKQRKQQRKKQQRKKRNKLQRR